MYKRQVLLLGLFMILESFGWHLPVWSSPIATFGVVGFFFVKSKLHLHKAAA